MTLEEWLEEWAEVWYGMVLLTSDERQPANAVRIRARRFVSKIPSVGT